MRVRILGSRGRGRTALLEKAVRLALGPERGRRGELCVVLLGDRQIRRVNRAFLRRDRVTDVIAFRHERVPGPAASRREEPPFGDVCIGLGAARRQARALGHGLERELATLAVHGVLHLRGYDDAEPAERRRMFARQERLVGALFGGA